MCLPAVDGICRLRLLHYIHVSVHQMYQKSVSGKVKLGIQAFADALLTIPKTLADNSGLDAQVSQQARGRGGDTHLSVVYVCVCVCVYMYVLCVCPPPHPL